MIELSWSIDDGVRSAIYEHPTRYKLKYRAEWEHWNNKFKWSVYKVKPATNLHEEHIPREVRVAEGVCDDDFTAEIILKRVIGALVQDCLKLGARILRHG